MGAAGNDHLDALEYFVDRGTDVNVPSSDGWAILTYAAANGQLDIVKFLIDSDTSVNVSNNFGMTALFRLYVVTLTL